MSRAMGIPPGVRRVIAEPDPIPVEFDFPDCVYSAWCTPELRRLTEREYPR